MRGACPIPSTTARIRIATRSRFCCRVFTVFLLNLPALFEAFNLDSETNGIRFPLTETTKMLFAAGA
jgi:hypothetical protein